MKRNLLIFCVMGLFILLWSAPAWAQCPEDPNDNGICDTMYVEVYPPDTLFSGPGHLVRVAIYVTHDVPDPIIDSIAGFLIPLVYISTNPSANCVLDYYYNNTTLYPSPDTDRSIFRHLEGVSNWMMKLSEQTPGLEWNHRGLNLSSGSNFWLVMNPTGTEDRLFEEGSRILLVTMTFKVDDTTGIYLDSCFWPPSDRLAFARSDAVTYIPRHNLPYCFSLSYPEVGDVNADGIIDVGDLVYLINYLYKGGPAPDPLEVGDCNSDGVIDLGDVVYLINYLFKGGPAPGPPIGTLLDYYGCKEFQKGTAIDSTPPDQDCIEYQYDGAGLLLLKHVNAGFNCCPDEILADITIEGNVITIEENESLESGGCYCLCLFDVDYQISNLESGEYTIRINGLYLEEGDEILQFTVDLASSPSGSFCVYRDHYPWGIW